MQFPRYRSRFLWGVKDPERLNRAIDEVVSSLEQPHGFFIADNVITWARNLGFVDDPDLRRAWEANAERPHERGILWRTAVVLWAARQAARREGAFVECGTYRGTTAKILVDAIRLERPFYLYDLFETAKVELPDHGRELHASVCARFADHPNVIITKGRVPESLANAPDKIAFLHIDMNDAAAEIAALDVLFHRVVPGGVVVFDDYGQLPYRHQFVAEREWFAKRGVPVLEIPTGQGLVIV